MDPHAVFLAAATGMRRGEVLALRLEDVDLGAGVLSVRQSLQQTKDGLTFKAPKTAKGRRLVALPAITVEVLLRHQHEQKKVRLALGPAFKDQGLVCCQPNGDPLNPSTVSHAFRRLARSLGLKDVHLHTLRHSHATQLLRQGVPVNVVSERLGHATTAITMDVYSHVLPGMQEEAARRVDAALRAALGNARQA